MKRCSKCGEIKYLKEFYKHPQTKDHRRSYCKICYIKFVLNYRKKNRKKYKKYIREYQREYTRFSRLMLRRAYILNLLWKIGITNPPEELIQMKREQILAKRTYNKIRKEIENEKRIRRSIGC